MYSTGYGLAHPQPRRRQPSSTSSTLLTPSEGSDWMPRASTSTSRSIFSDGDETNKGVGEGDEETEVGTVDLKVRDDRPLIDFGDETPITHRLDKEEVAPTPGDKLRMLLRQMEAEVRNTTPAPVPVPTRRISFHERPISEDEEEEATPAPIKSHWREGRRIGALPKERSYSPAASPERRRSEEEEEEVLDDSPPTPPLRITNPYLYNNRRVSDERRSLSPRISSRAAVLHASTSKSPPIAEPAHRTHLENYLARAPTSPSRKGKERATTPEPNAPTIRTTARGKGKTPRKWSVEIAPDDSVLFAEGIPDNQGELDIEDSVEPPWAEDETEDEGEMEVSPEMELPALPEIPASYEDTSEEEVVPITRPESRMRSRFSHSLSTATSQSRTRIQPRHSPSKQSPTNSRSMNKSQGYSDSPSRSVDQSMSFTTARTTSLNRSNRPIPPVQPIFPQEIQAGMASTPSPQISTPTKANLSVPGQTPKPPGAWLSTSRPRNTKFTPSPSPLSKGDTSIHRIKLSPRRSDTKEEEGDVSFTQRLISLTMNTIRPTIPKPSTTLIEARESLARAAEVSLKAQKRVEISQRQWLEALSSGAEVIKQGWTWGRWAWWVSMEILLLWGVFRVTLEYAQLSSHRPFDTGPSLALSIPLPTAISAFVIPAGNRRSANFFDILEGLEVWRILGAGEEMGRWVQVQVPT